MGVKKVSKDELMAQSDAISIHLVLSPRSRGLVGADDIAKMKKGAILINTVDPGREWKGSIEATYARFNDYRGRVSISGPLSDKIGMATGNSKVSQTATLRVRACIKPNTIRPASNAYTQVGV